METKSENLTPKIPLHILLGIFALLSINIAFVAFLLSKSERFNLFTLANETIKQYDGLLVEIEGGRCEGTEKTICHRLVYENDYKRVVSVGAETRTIRSELKSAAGSGKRVTIRGIETEYKKDNKKIPYILAKKVIIREDKSVTATQTVRIGMGGGVPLDEKCVDPKDKNRRCLLDDLGIKHAVTGVFWSVIEKDLGNYTWGAMTESDRKIAECNRLGIDCSVLITNAPAWAVSEATKKVGKYCPD
ncbi:hypothetical protein HYW55_06870, partial [Candidatus Gottesmanbacteria bacterium]|nr:hypothetical protein [Candidatus Gottesmanbacteria bacterium]